MSFLVKAFKSSMDEDCPSSATRGKIAAFSHEWPNAAYGPAHVVLEDFNLSDETLNWCQDLVRSALEARNSLVYPTPFAREEDRLFLLSVNWYASHSEAELLATKLFLSHLLSLPEEER